MRQPTLLLTRPRDSAERFADTLDPVALRGVRVLIAPLMRIDAVPVEQAGIAGAIFTSAQGPQHSVAGCGRPAWCVGARTTAVARGHGWDARCAGQTADALVRTLEEAPPQMPLVHLAGDHVRGDIAERLAAAGLLITRRTVYRQTLLSLDHAARAALDGPAVVPLFSPRTAEQFRSELTGPLPGVRLILLSKAVGSCLDGLVTAEMHVLAEPTSAEMRKMVENMCLRIAAA